MLDTVDAQTFEREWWGTAVNTFGEEAKQLAYAPRMGLTNEPQAGHWPVYNLNGARVLDLGGGPVSILLKTINAGLSTVVDPCDYPDWITARYEEHGVAHIREAAETFNREGPRTRYDEAWLYNVLQHVEDPEQVIETARLSAPLLRIFEWLETPASPGHPHTLTGKKLDRWIGGKGAVEMVNENGAVGLVYFGAIEL